MLGFDDIIESLQEIAQVAGAVGEDAIKANLENEIPPLRHLRAELDLALKLLDSHTWPPEQVPCRFDHHGGCQEHGFLALEPGEKCPNQEAHELLVRHGLREA